MLSYKAIERLRGYNAAILATSKRSNPNNHEFALYPLWLLDTLSLFKGSSKVVGPQWNLWVCKDPRATDPEEDDEGEENGQAGEYEAGLEYEEEGDEEAEREEREREETEQAAQKTDADDSDDGYDINPHLADTSIVDPEPSKHALTHRAPDITVLKVNPAHTKSGRPWHRSTKSMKVESLQVALVIEIKKYPNHLRQLVPTDDDDNDERPSTPSYVSFHPVKPGRGAQYRKAYLDAVEGMLAEAKEDAVIQAAFLFVNRELYKQNVVVARACSGDYWSWAVLTRAHDRDEDFPEPGTAEFEDYQPEQDTLVLPPAWSKKRRLGTQTSVAEARLMMIRVNQLFPDDKRTAIPEWIRKLLRRK